LAKLYVTGMIGGFDLDAVDFVKAVHALDVPVIDVHVNSPGGFVWDAMTMYEALKSHPATVTAHVDGLAGSAASFLIQAADHRVMATGSRQMIHDAQVVAFGSPAEIREMADIGDAVSNDIASIYAERAGGKPAAWRKAMTATTWYSAQEAVGAGLADRVATKQAGPDNRSRLIRARARVALGGVQ
jgi:ATP-dependent protease ClpP protease subunit